MMRRLLMACLAAALIGPLAVPLANAGTIKIGRFSDQATPRRAEIGARIDTSRETRASTAYEATPSTHAGHEHAMALPNLYPSLSARAPILRAAHPAGPRSFWYRDGSGHACMYAPSSVLPCFTVVSAGGAPGAAAVSPAGVAASVVRRLPLLPGGIKASPSRDGLTGAASWFWLDPAPRRQVLSVSLAREAVTVVAEPTVEWRFGDGGSLDGGPGVPYQAGAVPPDAVTHLYQTRCLPGDQGRDPYVLASCGADGYGVEALVVWRIRYQASGPIAASGTLPTRTTTTDAVYPVREARAFLVAGGGQ